MASIFGSAPLAFGIDSSMLGAGDARRDMLDESAERVKARRRAQARVPGAEGAAPMEREPEPVMADPFTAVDALLRGTVPAYSQARRDGLRAPTSREAVEGAVGMLPGAGLPEARQSFEDAAVAARQGDVMGAVGNTGWGALNAMDAFLPGPEFAGPLAAMAGGAGSRAGRQAMGGRAKVFLAEDGLHGDMFHTLGRENPVVETREEAADAAYRLLVEDDPYYATRPRPKVRWSKDESAWVAIPPRDLRVEPIVYDEAGEELAGIPQHDAALDGLYAEPKAMAEELQRRGYELLKGRKNEDGEYEVFVRPLPNAQEQ